MPLSNHISIDVIKSYLMTILISGLNSQIWGIQKFLRGVLHFKIVM